MTEKNVFHYDPQEILFKNIYYYYNSDRELIKKETYNSNGRMTK